VNIQLRFFASVREAVGPWAEALAHERALRMAFNQVMCEAGTPLAEGGEVAFFPPVTGG
jgi:molybdopterin synthase sulfur carrier subunit